MKLDVLKRFRQQTEDHCRLELADVEYRLAQAQEQQIQRTRTADIRATAYVAGSGKGWGANDAWLSHQAWEGSEIEVKASLATLATLTAERATKQAALALAVQERKQMELMAQRRLRERERKLRRREQLQLDDFANGRWAMAAQERTRQEQDEHERRRVGQVPIADGDAAEGGRVS